ncbi:uncharacterized protein [Ptychodera flava]|uniref:uncharacterized protein n=1 Tax=Ptychodera flava TaxID=63121 RepID=UPI003969CCC0
MAVLIKTYLVLLAISLGSVATTGCPFSYKGYCYVLVTQEVTWYAAKDVCIDGNYGKLASLHDSAESSFVFTTVFDSGGTTGCSGNSKFAWIGVHDLNVNGLHESIDNDTIDTVFVDWSGGCCDSNDHCVAFNADNNKWKELSCTDTANCGVLCKKDIDECVEEIDMCEQICINTLGNYTCDCSIGFELQGDGLTCADYDECFHGVSGCDQYCNNTEGSYVCYCDEEHVLGNDNHTCHVLPNPVFEFYSEDGECCVGIYPGFPGKRNFTLSIYSVGGEISPNIYFVVSQNNSCQALHITNVFVEYGLTVNLTDATVIGPTINGTRKKAHLKIQNFVMDLGEGSENASRLNVTVETYLDDVECLTNGSDLWVKAGVEYFSRYKSVWVGQLLAYALLTGQPIMEVTTSAGAEGNITRGDHMTWTTDVRHTDMTSSRAFNVTFTLISTPFVEIATLIDWAGSEMEPIEYRYTDYYIKYQFGDMAMNDQLSLTLDVIVDPDLQDTEGRHRFVGFVEVVYKDRLETLYSAVDFTEINYTIAENSTEILLPRYNCQCETLEDCVCCGSGIVQCNASICIISHQASPCTVTEFYNKGYLYDSPSDELYICDSKRGLQRTTPSCYVMKNFDTNVTVSRIPAGNILAMNQSTALYGAGRRGEAYLLSTDATTWFAISHDDWSNAMNGYVTTRSLPDGNSHPTNFGSLVGDQYGMAFDSVYIAVWVQIAREH